MSDLHRISFAISIGYFIYDSVFCTLYCPFDATMVVHHVLALAPLCFALFTNSHANETGLAFGMLELTNPLLHGRWMLLAMGKKGSFILFVEELVFFGAFIVIRLGIGTWLTYGVFINERVSDGLRYSSSLVQVLNVVWTTMMYKSFMRIVGKYQRKEFAWQHPGGVLPAEATTTTTTTASPNRPKKSMKVE